MYCVRGYRYFRQGLLTTASDYVVPFCAHCRLPHAKFALHFKYRGHIHEVQFIATSGPAFRGSFVCLFGHLLRSTLQVDDVGQECLADRFSGHRKLTVHRGCESAYASHGSTAECKSQC